MQDGHNWILVYFGPSSDSQTQDGSLGHIIPPLPHNDKFHISPVVSHHLSSGEEYIA